MFLRKQCAMSEDTTSVPKCNLSV